MKMKYLVSRKLTGFTIVELLVVIVIIGVLATVVTVGYSSWRNKIAEKEVRTDLSSVSSAMESAKNWSNGYPVLAVGSTFDTTATGAAANTKLFTSSPDVTLTYKSGDTTSFCIEATSKSTPNITYFINTADQKTPTQGTCADSTGMSVGVPPASPSPSASATSSSSIVVTWSAVSGATSYVVSYGVQNSVMSTASCSASPCTISGLTASTTYTISVVAVNGAGRSSAGTATVTTANASAPATCTYTLTVTKLYAPGNDSTYQLQYEKSTDSSYTTFGTFGGNPANGSNDSFTANLTGLSGVLYNYRVITRDSTGAPWGPVPTQSGTFTPTNCS